MIKKGITILYADVLQLIVENESKKGISTNTQQIIDGLNIDDTKGHRKVLHKAIIAMKEQKMIATVSGYTKIGGKCGKGYIPYRK